MGLKGIFELIKHSKIGDQRVVRDQLITEVISPILRNWGYKKKGRAFLKKEERIVKRLNVYSSSWNSKNEVEFIFEISAKGPGVDISGERAEEKWFTLTKDTDLKRISLEVREHLIKVVKPFLDKIR